MRYVWVLTLFFLQSFAPVAYAVEVAPRISDREIIEALAELKAGQQTLQQQINDLKQSTQQQIEDLRRDMNQRFENVDQRFNDLQQDMDQRFNDLRQDMNQRFNDVMTLLQILIGILVLVLGGMLAWLMVIWRRLVQEEKQEVFRVQADDIKFLKESSGRLQEMFLQLLERSPRVPQP